MSDSTHDHHDDGGGQNVLAIVRQIKAGTLNPKTLSPEDRRQCVLHLGAEGLTVPEIAEALQVSERTVARDRKANLEQNAIEPDPKLAEQIAGWLFGELNTATSRIRRLTRHPDTPAATKVEGERAVIEMADKVVARAQSLGILPSAAQKIEADLTHRLGEERSLQGLKTEIVRLQQIEQMSALTDEGDPPSDEQAPSPEAPSRPSNTSSNGGTGRSSDKDCSND